MIQKLFQAIFNGKATKPQPSEISGKVKGNEAKLLARKNQVDFFVSQLKRKFPDYAAQLQQLNFETFQFIAKLEPQVLDLFVKYVCNDKKPSGYAMRKYEIKLLEAANKIKIEPLKQICDRHLSKSDRKAESARPTIYIYVYVSRTTREWTLLDRRLVVKPNN